MNDRIFIFGLNYPFYEQISYGFCKMSLLKDARFLLSWSTCLWTCYWVHLIGNCRPIFRWVFQISSFCCHLVFYVPLLTSISLLGERGMCLGLIKAICWQNKDLVNFNTEM